MRKIKFHFPISRTVWVILLLAAITLTPVKAIAQVQIEPRYISITDGLATPTVYDVIQDGYGILWIGTANGLHKYDGYRLEVLKNIPGDATSLQDNQVWGVTEDSLHNLWVANSKGVSYYDRRINKFRNYTFSRYFNLPPTTNNRTFKVVVDSQQRVWALTLAFGLLEYKPETNSWILPKYIVPGLDNPNHFHLNIALTEDHKGGLWTASMEYGLMYRAKGDTIFRPIPQVAGLSGTNPITALYEDSTGTIWITARTGVYKYYPSDKELKTIIKYEEAATETGNHWNCIRRDPAGNIWIANNFRGILKFDGISDRFQEVTIAGKAKMKTYGWTILLTRFIIDHSGIFWFGSNEAGLVKYDPVNKPFTYLVHDSLNANSLAANGVYGILASKIKPGTIYIGSRGYGLTVYDTKQQTFRNFRFKAVDDMFGGSVRGLAEDNDGTIWLGTWGDGLVRLDKNYREITRYKSAAKIQNSISNNQVRVIKRDKRGRLWVGTNNGLNIFNDQSQTFQRINSASSKAYPQDILNEINTMLSSEQVIGKIDQVTDLQDKSQTIEIKNAGTYFVVAGGEADATSVADLGWIENEKKDTVWQMPAFRTSLWAGGEAKNRMIAEAITLQPGKYTLRFKTDDSHAYNKWNSPPPDLISLYGIALITPKDQQQVERIKPPASQRKKTLQITNDNITSIEFTDKYVWIGTDDGINRIDPDITTVKYYQYDTANVNSVNSNAIRELYTDSKGILWIATNNGIAKLDPDNDTITRYTEHDGLPTNLTETILEGKNGEMWIGTQSGLSQMVTNKKLGKITFINYNTTDGIGGDAFLALASARDANGRFYFGGEHGLTTFSSISSNNTPPLIVLSNLLISNKSVLEMGDQSPVKGVIEKAENITVSYNQNNLSFEFAALHYTDPQKNQYAHMLKGYDKDWIYDNRNFAAYTNLDPGKYEFIVRASNAFGIWNETGRSILVTILPPWWRTWWAYSLYAVAFLLISYLVYGGLRRQIRLREIRRTREKELAHAREIEKAYADLKATQSQLIQSEKMASLGELTAGIAHEIQNPLNFINNFSEVNAELIAEMKEEISKGNMSEVIAIADDIFSNEEKISHHGKRADAIVKGMLQHSRTGNSIKEPTDINALSDEYLRLSYHGLRAKDKTFNAKFETDFDNTIEKINVVPQDIGRVVLNLINNAFYAVNEKKTLLTPKGELNPAIDYEPIVSISTKKQGGKVLISVKDNGNGIPQHVVDKIFQPFFTTKPTGQGTGLGLSLSYDIVKAHGGELTVSSKQNHETIFTITLPTS